MTRPIIFEKTGECPVCDINLYIVPGKTLKKELPGIPLKMPCGIGPGRKSEEQCPFESSEEQEKIDLTNFGKLLK